MDQQDKRRSFSSQKSGQRYNARPSYRGGQSSGGKRFGSGGAYSSNRPGQYGSGRFQPRRGQSKLVGDPSIFIKKAQEQTVENAFTPSFSFQTLNISNPLKENILRKGYTNPTPIQDGAIQSILEDKDLIGLANTGTGKTAAFLIPIINKIFTKREDKALIIAPTRELATQISDELRSFSYGMKIYSALVIGGANMQRQIHDVRRNPHVVIGTPGRLKDLIERRNLNLEDFSIFVLDEVDLMVDIGFINDVKYFLSHLPEKRQSLFFSATISPKIKDILNAFVKNPVTVSVKQNETAQNIEQDIVKVEHKSKKVDILHDLLIKEGFDKVLIFGRTKHGVEDLNKELKTRGFKVSSIHGNKSQGNRQKTLKSFKDNEINILLATDVAARGLDIDNVTHVINYDLPETYDDYVHRIGRTGRANKKGVALTFVE